MPNMTSIYYLKNKKIIKFIQLFKTFYVSIMNLYYAVTRSLMLI